MSYLREYTLPIVVAVLLHAAVILLLTMSFVSKAKLPTVPPPKFITANIVQLKQQAKVQVQVDTSAAAAQKERIEEQRRRQEKQRQDQQRQEQQKKEQVKAEQEKQRQQQALAKKKADQARLQQEKAQQEKAQQEKAQQEKRQQEQLKQAKIQQEQQAALAQKAREEALLNSFQNEQQAQHNRVVNEQQAQSYAAIIQQAVIAHWNRPASARNDMEVLLDIQLIPNGTVISVTIAKSSGNDAFDRSAVAAVKKAERFPELAKMESAVFEQYFRNFRMRFKPEDLRL